MKLIQVVATVSLDHIAEVLALLDVVDTLALSAVVAMPDPAAAYANAILDTPKPARTVKARKIRKPLSQAARNRIGRGVRKYHRMKAGK